ncbi:nuclear transcription factor Y subunit B-3-like [Cornus florida]|uniref:nuclear transcription factor Y subunit B-3-like n=1 Tax=Cornus florida TaxID=4283 RepID=UPI002896D6A9|nr:nuclear transcription factor Y subunit B-3-like [Cornus florida]
MTGKRARTSPFGSPSSGNFSDGSSSKDQERLLPIANVSRIMKKSLPPNAKISKEAKETVQECASEFISFVTGEASDKCQREKRKTVNGDDLLWAMTTLGFENYVGHLKVYLNKYRESEGEKNSMARQEELSPTNSGTIYSTNIVINNGVNDEIGKVTSSSMLTRPDFNQSINRGYNSVGAQVMSTPKSFGDGGRVIGHGENLVHDWY